MEPLVRVNSHGGMASRVWCFTVEWLNRVDQRFRHRHTSLNLFEHDLQDFEIYTGPMSLCKFTRRHEYTGNSVLERKEDGWYYGPSVVLPAP